MPAGSRTPPLLEIRDLNISYWTRAGEIPAVIDFSLSVERGESVGLVGESGCGKSTVALAIMQLHGDQRLDQERQHQLQRDRSPLARPGRAAQPARLGDRDDLPGALRGPQPRPHHRLPAQGHPHVPRGGERTGGPGPGRDHPRRLPPSGSRAGPRFLSSPALGRPAAARGHRDGSPLQSFPAAARRAEPPPSTSRSRPESSTSSGTSAGSTARPRFTSRTTWG